MPMTQKQIEYAFLMIKVSDSQNVPPLQWGMLRWDGVALRQGWNGMACGMGIRDTDEEKMFKRRFR